VGAYPISVYVDDIAFLIQALRLGKVVAVGHSMGGIAVLELAAAHPDKVAAIVMVDPAPVVFPPELKAGVGDRDGVALSPDSGQPEQGTTAPKGTGRQMVASDRSFIAMTRARPDVKSV
jgi:pimeloyl-ACP methyl ester carboxylesterase